MRMRTLYLLFLTFGMAMHALGQVHEPMEVICKQTKGFHDGDTLTCVSGSEVRGTFVVRFAGIDAPEVGQAYWRASRDGLRTLAGNGTRASCYKADQYGREVCRLYSSDGEDIAEQMLSLGLAWNATRWAHEQTPEERRRYAALESHAREAKRGLWSEPDPLEPYQCRRLKAKKIKCR